MRLFRLAMATIALVLTLLTLTASAAGSDQWDKDDYEIFELQSALQESFPGTSPNFYSVLGVDPSANSLEVKRAYRKKSLELHPDKNAGTPNAEKNFERLGLIYKILRDHRKDRYDHFLTKGFPKWRKTGYYYQRYRPGLFSVLVGLLGFTILVEMGISRLTSWQEKQKIVKLKHSALALAHGPRYQSILHNLNQQDGSETQKGAAGGGKKVKLPISGFPDLPRMPSETEISNNKVDWNHQEKLVRKALSPDQFGGGGGNPRSQMVECMVKQKQVFLQDKFATDPNNEWIMLDEDEARPSTFLETWPFRLVHAVLNKFTGKHEDVFQEEEAEQDDNCNTSTSSNNVVPANGSDANANGKLKKRGKKIK